VANRVPTQGSLTGYSDITSSAHNLFAHGHVLLRKISPLPLVSCTLHVNKERKGESHPLRWSNSRGDRSVSKQQKSSMTKAHLNAYQDRFATYPTEFVKTRSQFGGKVGIHMHSDLYTFIRKTDRVSRKKVQYRSYEILYAPKGLRAFMQDARLLL
jgi:hypothetical protein